MSDHTEPDEATLHAEQDEGVAVHAADRQPTAEEEAAAESGYPESDEERQKVAAHEREMNELGAEAKGEGRID